MRFLCRADRELHAAGAPDLVPAKAGSDGGAHDVQAPLPVLAADFDFLRKPC